MNYNMVAPPINVFQNGALRAHQRITTSGAAWAYAPDSSTLCAHQRITTDMLSFFPFPHRCASYAPTNYNDFAGLMQPIEAGAFRVHQ